MKILFIPCYNCEKQIDRVIAQLYENRVMDFFDEIIIIDNQSTDNTIHTAITAINNFAIGNCFVFRNSQNIGLGGSHKMAFLYAIERNAEYIAVLHGDDQGDVSDLLNLMNNNTFEEYDCCLGSRFSLSSKLKGYSKIRVFGNYIFNILFTICSGKLVTDLGAGLNVYKVKAISDPRILEFSNDLTFNLYLLLFAINQKQKIHFFPITWKEDDQVSNVKLFSQSIKTFKIAINYLLCGEKSLRDNNIDFKTIKLEKMGE